MFIMNINMNMNIITNLGIPLNAIIPVNEIILNNTDFNSLVSDLYTFLKNNQLQNNKKMVVLTFLELYTE